MENWQEAIVIIIFWELFKSLLRNIRDLISNK
jgi:hypothetical protein